MNSGTSEVDRRTDLDALFVGTVCQHFDDAFQQLAQRFGARTKLEAADFDRGEIEEVFDELGERMA